MRLARDVTAANYVQKAKALIAINEGVGHVIAIRPCSHVEAPTPRQWGAWLAYFKRLGLRGYPRLMDRLGYFTVPAEWPHIFDAEATVQGDHAVADAFVAEQERQRRKFALDQEARQAARGNNIWPQIRREKLAPTSADHLRPRTPAEEAFAKMDPSDFEPREPEKKRPSEWPPQERAA